MSFESDFENDDVFKSGTQLLIDGDTIVYSNCCTYNNDTDQDRLAITRAIKKKVAFLLGNSGCDNYLLYLTTNTNFRNHLVDDYKDKRAPKPINLGWAKRWCVDHMNTVYYKGLEADDLLGVEMTRNPDTSVLWSIDKDLRQIPGRHLDNETQKVVGITPVGNLTITKRTGKKDKLYFNGKAGLYLQMLTGDSTDHIVGCGKRLPVTTKSGPNKGKTTIKRVGVGEKAAYNMLVEAAMKYPLTQDEAMKAVVIEEYKKIHGDDWQENLETQANLLWMVRYQDGDVIQRWTFDDREEYFDIAKGVIVHDYCKPPA